MKTDLLNTFSREDTLKSLVSIEIGSCCVIEDELNTYYHQAYGQVCKQSLQDLMLRQESTF